MKIGEAISNESKKCNSLSDFIEFVYSFRFNNKPQLAPLQKRNEIKSIIKILSKKKPKALLEIGTARGGTLFLLCKVASPEATIISIDLPNGPFCGETYPDSKIPLYQTFSTKNQSLHLIRANSHYSNTFLETKKLLCGKPLDFILIDGDHNYEGVKQDFEMYSALVSKGGMIAFHDINPRPKEKVGGVPEFWKKIKSEYQHFEILYDTQVEGFGLGVLFKS